MVTHKKTVSFKANKNDVEAWKVKAKSKNMTLSAFILDKLEKGNTLFGSKPKEWSGLLKNYKELHSGVGDSAMSIICSKAINVSKAKSDSVSTIKLTNKQLIALGSFLSDFLQFAIVTEN